jgi:glycerate 2-kinase
VTAMLREDHRTPGVDLIPSTVLVAPDAFKGTLSATTVAEAVGWGLEREGRPVELCPLADGGEGTLEALLEPLGAELLAAWVADPLGRRIEAQFGLAEHAGGGTVAIIEMAAASGLGLLDPDERDPLRASTAGTGELIVAAIAAGATRVYVGVGGSATTDGGSGALGAIERGGGLGDARLLSCVTCGRRSSRPRACTGRRRARRRPK